MSERDEIYDIARSVIDGELGILVNGSDIDNTADSLSYALIGAGVRKPRTITTAEELDGLAVGSIVIDRTGDTARKFRGGWRTTVAEPDGTAWLSGHMEEADLPATVLYEPTP